MATSAILPTPEKANTFIYGGKAVFTLRSKKTGEHISFRVYKSKGPDPVWFVHARKNGDAGQGGFNYAGMIASPQSAHVKATKKSHASTSTALRALNWALRHLAANHMPEQLEIAHEGRCACCGRPLTDPVSIERGIGPDCFAKLTGSKVIA